MVNVRLLNQKETHNLDSNKHDDAEQKEQDGPVDANIVVTHSHLCDVTKQPSLRHYVRLQGTHKRERGIHVKLKEKRTLVSVISIYSTSQKKKSGILYISCYQ